MVTMMRNARDESRIFSHYDPYIKRGRRAQHDDSDDLSDLSSLGPSRSASQVPTRVGTPSTVGSDISENSIADRRIRPAINFNFNAVTCFATYSRCRLSIPDFEMGLLAILAKQKRHNRATYYGGHEHHRDGVGHFHVIISYDSRYHTTSARAWDLRGSDGRIYHPNITTVTDVKHLVRYIEKEGNNFGLRPLARTTTSQSNKEARLALWRAIFDLPTREQKEAYIRSQFPDVFFKNFGNIKSCLDFLSRPPTQCTPAPPPEGLRAFKTYPIVEDWVTNDLQLDKGDIRRPRTLLIIGASRLGKSYFAQSLCQWYVTMHSEWNLAKASVSGAKVMIIDDIRNEAAFPYWKQVVGGQKRFDAHGRYEKVATLEWGFKTIWLANPENDPRTWGAGVKSYFDKNCAVLEVDELMYYEEHETIDVSAGDPVFESDLDMSMVDFDLFSELSNSLHSFSC